MTANELFSLRDEITRELKSRIGETTNFPKGAYVVGKDIKAGKYILTVSEEGFGRLYIFENEDSYKTTVAAALELKSWVGTQVKYYKGDTVESIVRQFESFQDLDCLVMMGRANEDNEGQKEVRKIAAFLKKYRSGKLTLDDLKNFTFNLSVGSFRCIEAGQGEEEVAALNAKWKPKK